MQINLSGHHVEVTDGIREAINSKFSKIESHYPNLDTLNIIVTVERNDQRVEVTTQYMGATVSAHGSNTDLYTAIAEVAKKLDSALAHRKGTTKSHRKDKANLV